MSGRPPRSVAVVVLAASMFAAGWALLRGGADQPPPGAAGPITRPPGPAPAGPAAAPAEVPAAPAEARAQRTTALAVAAAVADAAPSPQGALIVRVGWRDSPASVHGARVAVIPESEASAWEPGLRQDTDEHGVATFALAAGRYRIATVRGGDAGGCTVEPGQTTEFAIALQRGYTVAGRVVDESQRGVPGATIWLSARWSDRRGDVVAQSDADGRFTIDGVFDHRLVSATADHRAPSAQHEVHAEPGETRAVVLELGDGGAGLAGRVVDPAGQPVAALVLLGDERVRYDRRDETGRGLAGPLPRLIRTDALGRFAAAGLRPGPTAVQVRADGFAPATSELVAASGDGGDQVVQLQVEAVVAGTVVDERGEAVAQAQVRCGADGAFATAATHSDAAGGFELRGLPAGTVQVDASAPRCGSAREQLVLCAGATTGWQPTLTEAGGDGVPLSGVVVDADGAPRGRLTLSVRDAADTTMPGPQLRTDDDGAFTGRVPWHTVRIVVQAAGDWRAFPLLVVDSVRPADGPLRLELPDPRRSSGGIDGQVTSPDGRPVRARLTIWHQQARLWREYDTDEAGALQVSGVLPGDLDLEVRAEGHPWVVLGTRAVAAGDVLHLGTVRLPEAGHIRGTFTAPADVATDALQFQIYRDRGPEGAVVQAHDGHFESGPLAPAEYEVRIQGRGIRSFNRRVAVDAGATVLVHADLQRAAVRSIVLALPDGAPRPRWMRVLVRDGDGDLAWSGGVGPGGDDNIEVSLAPGDYRLEAAADGDLAGHAPLRVAGFGDAQPIRVELRRR